MVIPALGSTMKSIDPISAEQIESQGMALSKPRSNANACRRWCHVSFSAISSADIHSPESPISPHLICDRPIPVHPSSCAIVIVLVCSSVANGSQGTTQEAAGVTALRAQLASANEEMQRLHEIEGMPFSILRLVYGCRNTVDFDISLFLWLKD